MSKPWSRIDTTLLFWPFWQRLESLLADAEAQGYAFHVVSGFRTYNEQEKLYAQGRTTDGPIVTYARPGDSAHQFGLAADVCRDANMERAGLQPDWEPESYEPLRELAPQHGLVWGGTWSQPDRPHLNLPGFVTRVQLIPVRLAFEAGGLRGAWDYLDVHTKGQ